MMTLSLFLKKLKGRISFQAFFDYKNNTTIAIPDPIRKKPEFVATALGHQADKGLRLHFLSNVDIDNFGDIAARIQPSATLWIVISKTYTTAETTANTMQAVEFITRHGLHPKNHMVTVTIKGSPGDDPKNPVLRTFHIDFIGVLHPGYAVVRPFQGRYQSSGAVGQSHGPGPCFGQG